MSVLSANEYIKRRLKLLSKKNLQPFLYCVVKKKKNNFFSTVLAINSRVLFNKSCGSLAGMRGSKKYTTVAVESLAKETFLKIFALGYRRFICLVSFRFKVDKFARSFVRGMGLYSRKYMRMKVDSRIIMSHNGLRARKMRRV